jgi:hypothetical protein
MHAGDQVDGRITFVPAFQVILISMRPIYISLLPACTPVDAAAAFLQNHACSAAEPCSDRFKLKTVFF